MRTTIEQFKTIPPGEIFRVVTTKYVIPQKIGLTFVCKKGMGDDWAIFYHGAGNAVKWIEKNGIKLKDVDKILSIFPCDELVLNLYRL